MVSIDAVSMEPSYDFGEEVPTRNVRVCRYLLSPSCRASKAGSARSASKTDEHLCLE